MSLRIRWLLGAAVVLVGVVGLGLATWSGGSSTVRVVAAANETPPPQTMDAKTLRVIAANIRVPDAEDKGPAAWAQRRELLVRTLLNHHPDIVGFQEDSPAQQLYLIQKMQGYAHVPREAETQQADGPTGGGILTPLTNLMAGLNTIFYRTERFELRGWVNGPLRPDAPQDRLTENTFYTLAVLADKNKVFPDVIVLDTHLRHGIANAVICAQNIHGILAEQLKIYPKATLIVLGDMNHDRTEKVYPALLGAAGKEAPELVDCFDYSKKAAGEKWGTWHAFVGRANREWPTDLILVSKGATYDPTVILRDHEDDDATGKWPSDHYFVETVLRAK